MTTFAHPARQADTRSPIPAPSLAEWTAAYALTDGNARRVAVQLLYDRRRASEMGPWEGRLYLKRHVIGFAFRWLLLGAIALWVSPWAWVPIAGIPLYGLWQFWRGTHG